MIIYNWMIVMTVMLTVFTVYYIFKEPYSYIVMEIPKKRSSTGTTICIFEKRIKYSKPKIYLSHSTFETKEEAENYIKEKLLKNPFKERILEEIKTGD